MDPISLIILCTLGISIFLYVLDPKGWNATGKRLTRIVRANIEGSKKVKAIETKSLKQDALDSWTESFESVGKPVAISAPVQEPKHKIVKHGYYKSAFGDLWPEWTCKCGATGHEPTGIWSDAETHKNAAREGRQHVTSANLAEERMEKARTTDFAW